MPENTFSAVETWPKATTPRAKVEEERKLRLTLPLVISSEITDNSTNWILTTVMRPVIRHS